MARTGDGGACGSAHAVSVAGTQPAELRTSEKDPPMSEERNAKTYRRWFDEGCSQGNVDLADEL
jgi:hypothetical protein